jgi:hypothetical protein
MSDTETKGEMHGCIVCGRPYQVYAVYDGGGRFIDMKVMSVGAKAVRHAQRPLVACDSHTEEQIKTAVAKAYGPQPDEDD